MPEGPIIVIGRRIYDPAIFSFPDEGSGASDNPQLTPSEGGGGGDWTEQSYRDCLKDGVAWDVAEKIRNFQISLEQGAVIYKEADGHVTAGVVSLGTDEGVSPNVPASVGYANILGQIHSHPPTGDTIDDAYMSMADRYPSPDDWASIGALGERVAAAGGSINMISVYIVDQSGAVREFPLADRATYDVPIAQLRGDAGSPPPPPLPEPMTSRPVC